MDFALETYWKGKERICPWYVDEWNECYVCKYKSTIILIEKISDLANYDCIVYLLALLNPRREKPENRKTAKDMVKRWKCSAASLTQETKTSARED